MSRYFFHVMDGRASVDTEGTEFSTLNEARAQALHTAGMILRDQDASSFKSTEWHMTVADEAGDTVFSLRFSANSHGR